MRTGILESQRSLDYLVRPQAQPAFCKIDTKWNGNLPIAKMSIDFWGQYLKIGW